MTAEEIRTAKIVAAAIGVGFLLTVVIIEIILGLVAPRATFSNILRGWAIVGLAAPFGWGTLAGHFFHPVDELRSIFHGRLGDTPNLIVAVLPIVVLAIVDVIVAAATKGFVYPRWVSPTTLGIGCVWGALAWPVRVVE